MSLITAVISAGRVEKELTPPLDSMGAIDFGGLTLTNSQEIGNSMKQATPDFSSRSPRPVKIAKRGRPRPEHGDLHDCYLNHFFPTIY